MGQDFWSGRAMSCRQWERGSFVLPGAAMKDFRRTLVNFAQEELSALEPGVRAVYPIVRDAYKNKSREDGYGEKVQGPLRKKLHEAFLKNNLPLDQEGYYGKVLGLLFPTWSAEGKCFVVPRPTQKMFSVPSGRTEFSDGTATLSLDVKNRTVTWEVPESNHAVDRAWTGPLGRAFSEALEAVVWTRATGGAIFGSDEYADEAARDHGGSARRINRHCGPLGEKAFEGEYGYRPVARKVQRFGR